jgi:hypothetical protein
MMLKRSMRSSFFRSFRNASNDGHEKESRHSYFSPLSKRRVLGTIIDMKGGADSREA